MDNRISLGEYLSSYRVVSEKRKVFYAISRELHRYHNDGFYILDLSFQTISVCFTNPYDIHFSKIERIGKVPIEEVLKIKQENIKKLCHLMICSYLDSFNYQGSLVDFEVLKNNFTSLGKYYHKDDFSYFEKILFSQEYLYYDDYLQSLDGNHTPFLEKPAPSNGAFASYFLLIINLTVALLILAYLSIV